MSKSEVIEYFTCYLVRIMNNKKFQIKVMIIFAIFCYADNFSSTIEIKDIYKIDEQNDEILHADYGLWDTFKRMVTYEANIFYRRSNFHGHTLRYFYVFDTK